LAISESRQLPIDFESSTFWQLTLFSFLRFFTFIIIFLFNKFLLLHSNIIILVLLLYIYIKGYISLGYIKRKGKKTTQDWKHYNYENYDL